MSNLDFTIEQAKQLANSPQGKMLAQLLRQMGGTDLQRILDQAAAGDLNQARAAITALMEDPQARALLEQLGGAHGKS